MDYSAESNDEGDPDLPDAVVDFETSAVDDESFSDPEATRTYSETTHNQKVC